MKGTSRSDGGEIVQVEGGHILRSTGRKDRHSKVYTAKGPRDRRVRLSAHTAIQFYDVQDRLGYDRPSKAVDWLINKAKTAIDKLNDGSNPSSQLHHGHTTETLSGYALIQPPNSTTTHDNNPSTAISSFSGFSNNAVLARPHHHLHQFDGQDLGLSLHPFQENFQRMEGYFMNNQSNSCSQGMINSMFSAQGELLQSNLDHTSMDDQQSNDRGRPSWDFGNPFEPGFRVPAGIYGDDDDDDQQQQ